MRMSNHSEFEGDRFASVSRQYPHSMRSKAINSGSDSESASINTVSGSDTFGFFCGGSLGSAPSSSSGLFSGSGSGSGSSPLEVGCAGGGGSTGDTGGKSESNSESVGTYSLSELSQSAGGSSSRCQPMESSK
jgi:hypothetical protein